MQAALPTRSLACSEIQSPIPVPKFPLLLFLLSPLLFLSDTLGSGDQSAAGQPRAGERNSRYLSSDSGTGILLCRPQSGLRRRGPLRMIRMRTHLSPRERTLLSQKRDTYSPPFLPSFFRMYVSPGPYMFRPELTPSRSRIFLVGCHKRKSPFPAQQYTTIIISSFVCH